MTHLIYAIVIFSLNVVSIFTAAMAALAWFRSATGNPKGDRVEAWDRDLGKMADDLAQEYPHTDATQRMNALAALLTGMSVGLQAASQLLELLS